MNYSQFYRSPIGPRKMNEEEKTDVGNYSLFKYGNFHIDSILPQKQLKI